MDCSPTGLLKHTYLTGRMMADVQPQLFINKAQQVARLLLDRILREDLSQGSSFGTEADLLEQYEVSRPTMRESLRVLESQGVLKLRPGPNGGIIVAKPRIDTLAATLSIYLRLHRVPMEEILRARMAIEPALGQDAARYGTEAQFAEMEESIKRMAAAHDDAATIYSENREFHSIIARAANNPVLGIFWQTISALASGEGDKLKFTQRNRDHIVKAHAKILDACRKRDHEAARKLTVDHLKELETLLRKRSQDRQRSATAAAR
jgi:GntR family transcriptional regulator, transcriptional repressor for pyruvate dehydrogenase complex